MQRHPYFDLRLHDDDELADRLGCRVVARRTLHEWPLSCVQRLHLADGSTRIYKVQTQPTVEPEFYAQAAGRVLVAAQPIPIEGEPAALLLEEIDAPRLCDLELPPSQLFELGKAVIAQIGELTGTLPVCARLRTPVEWVACAGEMIAGLTDLASSGVFTQVNGRVIDRIAHCAHASAVLAAFSTPVGYVHSDLTGSNIFVTAGGYRVIDWQRPRLGPIGLDLAALLESQAVDPRLFLPSGIVDLFYLLRIEWFVQCAGRWFPPGAPTYDAAIVQLAGKLAETS